MVETQPGGAWLATRVAYHTGEGTAEDDPQAADQGYAEAQFQIGLMCDRGQGVEQDDMEAAAWYREAAEQGYAEAQFRLGLMYDRGQGVEQDEAEATWWYRLAAEQGMVKAQSTVGARYNHGKGVVQDCVEAHKWMSLAASRAAGDDPTPYARRRDALARRMTPPQVQEG